MGQETLFHVHVYYSFIIIGSMFSNGSPILVITNFLQSPDFPKEIFYSLSTIVNTSDRITLYVF